MAVLRAWLLPTLRLPRLCFPSRAAHRSLAACLVTFSLLLHFGIPTRPRPTHSPERARGRILITGGAGRIGQLLVPRLHEAGNAMTILNLLPPSSPSHLSDHAASSLHYLHGDVHNLSVLLSALTPDITGIIHLAAALAHPTSCGANAGACTAADARNLGTERVLKALRERGRPMPWFLLPSPSSSLLSGHAQAEAAPSHASGLADHPASLGAHAMILRLAQVYGSLHDHPDLLIPSTLTQVLAHLPVQILGGEQELDLLHIDDCVDAFLLAIQRLSRHAKRSWWGKGRERGGLAVYDISSGIAMSMRKVVDHLLCLTKSHSPVQQLRPNGCYPPSYMGSTQKAADDLGFRAQVGLKEGLLQTVEAYMQRNLRALEGKIFSDCLDPPHLEVNTELEKLDDCQVHLDIDVSGRLAALRPQAGRLVVSDDLPPAPLRARVKQDGGRWLVLLNDWHKPGKLFGPASELVRGVRTIPNNLASADAEGGWWELELSPSLSSLKLLLPGTSIQLTPPNRPRFGASIPKAVCGRMRRAADKLQQDLASLSLDLLAQADQAKLDASMGPASKWTKAQLPICTNLCDLPGMCVDTGDWAVLGGFPTSGWDWRLAERLQKIQEDGNLLLELVKQSSWKDVLRPHAHRYMNTNEPWPRVHVANPHPWLQEWLDDPHTEKPALLRGGHCFSADVSMELPLREISVQPEEAELVFMPFYQKRFNAIYNDQWKLTQSTFPTLDTHKFVIPFSHDYGTCLLGYEVDVFKLRSSGMSRLASTRDVMAWSVMGDINEPCFKPLQDITIPPRTCGSPQLFAGFEDMALVRPSRQRKVLATFKGSIRGSGANTRVRVNCEARMSALEEPDQYALQSPHRLITIWDGLGGYNDYYTLLNDTIFCPVPDGVTGWMMHLEDAIYAGCIPVLIGHATQHPFWDMIDWGKISITVERRDLQWLEQVLLGFSMEYVEQIQANLMLIRDAFLYPLDGDQANQLKRRGPLFFALHSAKMRLLTMYLRGDLVDRPDWSDTR
ncbi:glycosyltransferase family 47 protein [Calocera viscosa TUFC12733]|uniref:Glycosyltransferase family 47 protein n=1 Tax=Calocera viscosa (strain TUFC12733) TaxID=1330018 RepID=A0A167GTB3_CALVF|nr:glycosyltransferase family 47 protein [Calocera viscosa TUFC12733]